MTTDANEPPPVGIGPPVSRARRLASHAVERTRVVGDAYDRFVRDADGTMWKGDGTAPPLPWMGNTDIPAFYDLYDFGARADGVTDLGPILLAAIAKCAATGVRRLKLRGSGGTASSYYLISTPTTIPVMPPIHTGAPYSTLTIEGDGYGSTMIAGPLTCAGSVRWRGIELSGNITITGPDIHASIGGYPHYFEHCELQAAAIVPTVDAILYLLNSRCQFNGGWVVYCPGSGLHLQVFLTGCEISTAYIVGGAGANIVDALSISGGRVGSIYPFTALVDANITATNARVGGVFGLANQ